MLLWYLNMIAAAHHRSILTPPSSWSDSVKHIFYRKSSAVKEITRWCCGSSGDEMRNFRAGIQDSGTSLPPFHGSSVPRDSPLPWTRWTVGCVPAASWAWSSACVQPSAVLSPRRPETEPLSRSLVCKPDERTYIHHPLTQGIKNSPYLSRGCPLDWRWEPVWWWNPP